MKKKWGVNKTLLIVGEGYSEEAFLKHVRQFPEVRGNGVKITIKNARGKGAADVIDSAIKTASNYAYDAVAVLLDTDTDWNKIVEKRAKTNRIQVLTSEPCLEGMLLRVLGQNINQQDLKKQFAPYVNGDATCPEKYAQHFGREVLIAARQHEKTIDELLSLFRL